MGTAFVRQIQRFSAVDADSLVGKTRHDRMYCEVFIMIFPTTRIAGAIYKPFGACAALLRTRGNACSGMCDSNTFSRAAGARLLYKHLK